MLSLFCVQPDVHTGTLPQGLWRRDSAAHLRAPSWRRQQYAVCRFCTTGSPRFVPPQAMQPHPCCCAPCRASPREQHVCRLDVEVHNLAGVEVHQRARHVQRNLAGGGGASAGPVCCVQWRCARPRATAPLLPPLCCPLSGKPVACAPRRSPPPLPPPPPPAPSRTFFPRRYQATFCARRLWARLPPSMYSVTSRVRLSWKQAPCKRGWGAHMAQQGRQSGVWTDPLAQPAAHPATPTHPPHPPGTAGCWCRGRRAGWRSLLQTRCGS